MPTDRRSPGETLKQLAVLLLIVGALACLVVVFVTSPAHWAFWPAVGVGAGAMAAAYFIPLKPSVATTPDRPDESA